jgi:3-hydroxyacyl-[acyl-carrier-protein] dehydratase
MDPPTVLVAGASTALPRHAIPHKSQASPPLSLIEEEGNESSELPGGFAMAVMEQAEIQALLPHRYPFLLVDRVLELEPDRRIVGIKNVTVNEPFFQGHFPGRPVMPGVLILEAMAQVGGLLAFKSVGSASKPVVYLTGVDGAKFRKPVVPGDRLRFEIDVLKKRSPFWKMAGKAYVETELVCEAEVTAMVTEEKA